MRAARRNPGEEIESVLAFLGVLWAVYLVGLAAPGIARFGLTPRTTSGLVGIVAMPFLHGSFAHLLGNTVPLLVLTSILAASRPRWRLIVAEIIVAGGSLLWVFGRPAIHIGASGLVFGLVAFLIVSGLVERRPSALLVSLVVGFLYGGALVAGVVPGLGAGVSWDGHLCGASAGAATAVAWASGRRRGDRAPGARPRSIAKPAL
jgi:membrane associated rhomboid family serine protease